VSRAGELACCNADSYAAKWLENIQLMSVLQHTNLVLLSCIMPYANSLPVVPNTRGTCNSCQRGGIVVLQHGGGVHVLAMHTVASAQCPGSYSIPEAISIPEATYAIPPNQAVWPCENVPVALATEKRKLCSAVRHSSPTVSAQPVYAPNRTTKPCCGGSGAHTKECKAVQHG
jgi:hypothetical protein